MQDHPRRRLPRTRYVTASPETWSLIRGAYLSGMSAPAVAARFGVSETSIRRRAGREGWTKAAFAARATPWAIPPAAKALVAQSDAAAVADGEAAREAPVLDHWRAPIHIQPTDLARKALAGAMSALKAGEGLNALRLARAASEIARLNAALDWADEDVADSEAAAEFRHQQMQMFIRERALGLAEDLVAGRELPPEYVALKEELARLRALNGDEEGAGVSG